MYWYSTAIVVVSASGDWRSHREAAELKRRLAAVIFKGVHPNEMQVWVFFFFFYTQSLHFPKLKSNVTLTQ